MTGSTKPPEVPSGPRPRGSNSGRGAYAVDLVVRLLIVVAAVIALLPFVALVRGALISIRAGFLGSETIGVTLALVALTLGSFFFLYSIKYYLATLVVLVSSLLLSNGNGNGTSNGNGNGSTDGNGHPQGLMRFLRRGRGHAGEHESGGWIGPFDLGYEPFVSIHIATYNEKRVIGRLLEGCAALDYQNYEVIVVDDSNDETTAILQAWQGRPRFKIIHRAGRNGFKGGALQEALLHTDSRAEFVIVWDADVVPFPDSIQTYLPHFFKNPAHANGNGGKAEAPAIPEPRPEVAAVQSYQWHVLNKSESWLTESVRAEYAGSYMVERPFQEFIGSMKMIAGTAYMIRAHLLRELGWGRSLTEDWELTLRLYARGFKVVYTPYAETPAECVGTFTRLARQRMRWAEGHSYNVRRYFGEIMLSPHIDLIEKIEFLFYTTYYFQAALFVLGSSGWLIAELLLHAHVPEWTALLGWSLLLTNLLSLPAMNLSGLLLEEAPLRDISGILGALATSFLLMPFQAYAALKGFLEKDEGPWYRTPKTGRITDPVQHLRRLKWLHRLLFGDRQRNRRSPQRAHLAVPQRPTRNRGLGWALVGALILALGGLGFGAIHAPVAEAAGTVLYLHGAAAFTLDTVVPAGAVPQTFGMTAAGASRTWATTTPTGAAQTISSGTAFTFNYWTAAAPAGTSNVTLRLGYSPSSTCGRAGVIANVQTGPEVQNGTGGNVTATMAAGSRAGDLLVATVVGGTNVAAFTGPAGWVRAIATGTAVNGEVEIWYLANSPAGVTSAAFTSASNVSIAQMSEWSGVSTTTPLDKTGIAISAVNVASTTVSTSAADGTAGDLGITAVTWTRGNLTSSAGWSALYRDNAIASASDFQLGLPAAVVSETFTSSQTTLWADAIATFTPAPPAAVVTIAQSTLTLTNGSGLSTAPFTPGANVVVPAGSFLCFTVSVNSVTGGGLVLDSDAAATPTNLNATQTIFIPELVLPLLGVSVLIPLAARLRRRRRTGGQSP